MNNLTKMEIKILNAMRDNEYQDALEDGCTWTFTAIDNSGIEPRKARGVISSLIKKGLVEVDDQPGDENTISFTNEGEKLFDNSNGNECPWGGKKLLKEI